MNEPVRLTARHVIALSPTAPFCFDTTLHKPDHFPSTDNLWEPGVRWQTMRWGGEPIGLKLENHGSVEHPAVSLSVWSVAPLSQPFLDALVTEITYRYNLQMDLADFYCRFESDAQLGPVLEKWRGLRPFHAGSLYEYLIIAIVLQNCTVRRSVHMLRALFENFGTPLVYDGLQLDCFWEPESLEGVSEDALRVLKVGYRAKSIQKASTAFVKRQIDELTLRARSEAQQREALLNLYGIGPASVGYILFDVFHRWDELNHVSPWEQKIYSRLFFATPVEEPVPVETLRAYFDARFAGYRMLAVHYLWEDLFWRRQHEQVLWLEQLIRL
jgi:3-methyladenine DNA glycosylase/8-oxoguanine DNA glycosylase